MYCPDAPANLRAHSRRNSTSRVHHQALRPEESQKESGGIAWEARRIVRDTIAFGSKARANSHAQRRHRTAAARPIQIHPVLLVIKTKPGTGRCDIAHWSTQKYGQSSSHLPV